MNLSRYSLALKPAILLTRAKCAVSALTHVLLASGCRRSEALGSKCKIRPEIFRFRVLFVVREAGLEVHFFYFMYSNPSILAKYK